MFVSYTVQGETGVLTQDKGQAIKAAGSSFYSVNQLSEGLHQEVNSVWTCLTEHEQSWITGVTQLLNNRLC